MKWYAHDGRSPDPNSNQKSIDSCSSEIKDQNSIDNGTDKASSYSPTYKYAYRAAVELENHLAKNRDYTEEYTSVREDEVNIGEGEGKVNGSSRKGEGQVTGFSKEEEGTVARVDIVEIHGSEEKEGRREDNCSSPPVTATNHHILAFYRCFKWTDD